MKRLISVAILVPVVLVIAAFGPYAVESNHKLTKNEVKTLIRNAKSPEDHFKIARYYRAEAARLETEVKDHEEMAEEYYRNPIGHPVPKWPTLGQHCRDLVTQFRNAAQAAKEMATLHEQMAKDLEQKR